MFLVSLAEGFIHLFQAAGKIFLDMMTGLIPMLICLLLAINFLMKLVGTVRMEKVAALLGRSRILTYGVLPVLGWFFMSSPGALTLGKLLPEKSKPGYEDALGTPAHPLTSLFPHVVPSELFVWLGVAAGVKALGLPVTSLALRYIAAAMLIGLIRGIITEYLFLRLSRRGNAPCLFTAHALLPSGCLSPMASPTKCSSPSTATGRRTVWITPCCWSRRSGKRA